MSLAKLTLVTCFVVTAFGAGLLAAPDATPAHARAEAPVTTRTPPPVLRCTEP